MESKNHAIHWQKGTPFYAECVCGMPGYNAKHIKWLDSHNQEIDVLRLGTDQKAYTERDNDQVKLYIPNVTNAVSGLYRCVTNFEGKDYSHNYYIEAYEPVTINPPEEQFVLLGNRSLVKCKVHAEDMSKILVSWTKIEEDETRTELTNSAKYDITDDGLYINDVTNEDKGKYTCSAYDKKNLDEVDKDINVKIITKPRIKEVRVTSEPEPPLVAGISRLVMKCIAEGIPQLEYIWRRTDTGDVDNPRWKKEANAIMIEPVLAEDQGQYECVAQSMAGVATKSVDIEVFLPPNITSFPSITESEGTTVQLVCNANGRPAPNISIIFFKTDGDDDVQEIAEDEIIENLSFIRLDKSREGIYICNASNEVNYTTEEMYVTVFYKPHYELKEETIWGWDGHFANLSCEVDSNPIATIRWGFTADYPRTHPQIDPDDYMTKTLSVTLAKYLPVNVSEEAHSLYGWYECNATNHLGLSTKKIHFQEGHVPPPIKNATVVTVTATSATFYIEEPGYFQGPSVHGYIGEYDMRETFNITNIHMNRSWSVDRPFTIDRLKPNTSYLVRFAAVNQVGYSEWCEYMEFETLEPSAPGIPIWKISLDVLSGEIVNVTDTNQALSWKMSDSEDAPVDYYKLRYCPINEENPCKEQKVEPNAELKTDFSILDHNTTYFIELVAHNNVGDSTPANITITTPAQVAGPVHRLSAGALIGISIVVVFICLVVVDVLLLLWKRQGMIANCCCRKKKRIKKLEDKLQTRDKKGLLKDSRDAAERSPNNRPKEYEYNKTTGVITGKHSAV
ncbi:hypothetical protein evm_010165 [Chilo suppressalis]|nr:hypothetical protein evm_010165 [Chilo suppressalis]